MFESRPRYFSVACLRGCGRGGFWAEDANYALAYAIGFHPWEDLAEHPPFAGKLLELIAREEDSYGPPCGRALDLGTG